MHRSMLVFSVGDPFHNIPSRFTCLLLLLQPTTYPYPTTSRDQHFATRSASRGVIITILRLSNGKKSFTLIHSSITTSRYVLQSIEND